MGLIEGLQTVREGLVALQRPSHTSIKFQDDIIRFIESHAASGRSLIEVGCYHGGMTVQMAFAAKALGLEFNVIDINHHYLGVAADTADRFQLADAVHFHAMDLATFVRNSPAMPRAALVFVDGDHRYDGVVADLRAIRSMSPVPFAAAFHDYSLRYADGPLTNVRVDQAIHDEWGRELAGEPIGEIARADGPLRTLPGEDRHYHAMGEPEGLLVRLAQ
jgi:hypothetical protein